MHHPERFLSLWKLDQPVRGETTRMGMPRSALIEPAFKAATVKGRMAEIHAPIAARVAAAVAGRRGVSCLVGDCCTTTAVLAGIQRAGVDPLLVWLDAHGDFNTPQTSPSGFLPGMALAMLTGRGDQELARAAGLRALPDRDALLVNARDLDPLEREALGASGVRRVKDPGDIVRQLSPDRPIYVHFDTDIIDPAEAPAVQFPVPGGPSLAEVKAAFRALHDTGRVVAASLTLWDFEKDEDGQTAEACLGAFGELTG